MSGDRETAALATAAELACAVDDRDKAEIARILHPLTVNQLYALAVVLAAHVDVDRPLEPIYSPERTCHLAVQRAASVVGVDPEAVASRSRDRAASCARAIAMTVARRAGVTTTVIGKCLDRDHTTVIAATERVARDPRLSLAADRILADLGLTKEAA